MAKVERMYVIPLRRDFLKVPRWRKTKRAVATVQAFLKRHTKMDTIKLDRWLNEHLWARGGKNPPGKITVKVTIDKAKKTASAELANLSSHAKRTQKKLEEKAKAESKKKKKEEREEKAPEKKELTEEEKKENKKRSAPSKEQERFLHE